MLKKYKEIIFEKINTIADDENILEAAKLISNAYKNGNNTFTFGTGHSHMLGEELYARAGGWNYIKPILQDELTLSSHPFKSTLIERVEGYSEVLLGLFNVKNNDVVIITSNSGRNGLIVEMALQCKKRGAKVIAVTSLEHSSSITSRHTSDKLLKDIADIVIDNKSPSGDAVIKIGNDKIGPISTIDNLFIGHSIVLETLNILENENIDYEIFVSSNLDGQDDRNKKLMENK